MEYSRCAECVVLMQEHNTTQLRVVVDPLSAMSHGTDTDAGRQAVLYSMLERNHSHDSYLRR